jgi:hypothetical protein
MFSARDHVPQKYKIYNIIVYILGVLESKHDDENRCVVWDITPCNPVKVNRLIGGTYRLHLQGRRLSQPKSQNEKGSKLLGLVLDPGDAGDIFLRNVG